MNTTEIKIIEINSLKYGNLRGTIQNKLRKVIKSTFDTVSYHHDCGQIKSHKTGQLFDWWVGENDELTAVPSE